MRTDVAIDKLCNIAPVIADMEEKISKDKEFKSFIKTYNSEKSNKVILFKGIPPLLTNYCKKLYVIVTGL